jgi:hypothetical protein
LLHAALSALDRDAVVGDLCEEYRVHVVPARGTFRARWWYRWQVARSLAPLFMRSWERASLENASVAIVAAALVALGPAAALVSLRTFVLQQVPLKTTTEISVAFAAALIVAVVLAGALGFAVAIRLLHAETRER